MVTTRYERDLSTEPPGAWYDASIQMSPQLFVAKLLACFLRSGFGPSTFGVNIPESLMEPTNFTSSSSGVAMNSDMPQLAATGPKGKSSAVCGFPSGPA